MLGLLSLLGGVALAGNVYLNEVLVNPADLSKVTLTDVTVRFDPNGTIRIDAPRYRVETVSTDGAPRPPAPGSTPVAPPTAAPRPPVAPPATAVAPPATAVAPPTVAAAGSAARVPAPPAPAAVPSAQYWLVTEDNGSFGHAIEITVNGQLLHRIESGHPQKILDIGSYLRRGPNQVVVSSNSVSAGGGSFYVYLGRGSDQSGTVVMDKPEVQYGLGPTRAGPFSREYTINVP